MSYSSSSTNPSPVYSEFADDPDFHELLQTFLDSLNEQRSDILSAYQNRQWDNLHRIAHQLKGSGGGYGFPGLTGNAHALEVAVKEQNETAITSTLEDLLTYLDRLHA